MRQLPRGQPGGRPWLLAVLILNLVGYCVFVGERPEAFAVQFGLECRAVAIAGLACRCLLVLLSWPVLE